MNEVWRGGGKNRFRGCGADGWTPPPFVEQRLCIAAKTLTPVVTAATTAWARMLVLGSRRNVGVLIVGVTHRSGRSCFPHAPVDLGPVRKRRLYVTTARANLCVSLSC